MLAASALSLAVITGLCLYFRKSGLMQSKAPSAISGVGISPPVISPQPSTATLAALVSTNPTAAAALKPGATSGAQVFGVEAAALASPNLYNEQIQAPVVSQIATLAGEANPTDPASAARTARAAAKASGCSAVQVEAAASAAVAKATGAVYSAYTINGKSATYAQWLATPASAGGGGPG